MTVIITIIITITIIIITIITTTYTIFTYRAGVETVLKQAQNLLTKSLLPINQNLEDKEYLIGKFSGADVMLGHACFMANRLGCVGEELSAIKSY